jgi:hypothetical protein
MGRLAPEIAPPVRQTGTDMSTFEDGWDDDPWCHTRPYPSAPLSLCGMSMRGRRAHRGTWDTEACSGCGKPNCPDCQQMERGLGR